MLKKCVVVEKSKKFSQFFTRLGYEVVPRINELVGNFEGAGRAKPETREPRFHSMFVKYLYDRRRE